jgi:signal transduction histidine kinase
MDRTKMRFIQVAAHELRTPLTVVQGYAQMIQMKLKGHEDFTSYTESILDGSNRMVEIIDSMLDVSRIDTNQLRIMPEEIQVGTVVEKVRKVFQCAFEERNICFTTTGIADLPPICADQDLLYKVFYHVIGNAIKYTPDGGRVTVTGQIIENITDPEIEITIQDRYGIDPKINSLSLRNYQSAVLFLRQDKFNRHGMGLIARGIECSSTHQQRAQAQRHKSAQRSLSLPIVVR